MRRCSLLGGRDGVSVGCGREPMQAEPKCQIKCYNEVLYRVNNVSSTFLLPEPASSSSVSGQSYPGRDLTADSAQPVGVRCQLGEERSMARSAVYLPRYPFGHCWDESQTVGTTERGYFDSSPCVPGLTHNHRTVGDVPVGVDGGGSCSSAIGPVIHAQAAEMVRSAAVGSGATPPQTASDTEISQSRSEPLERPACLDARSRHGQSDISLPGLYGRVLDRVGWSMSGGLNRRKMGTVRDASHQPPGARSGSTDSVPFRAGVEGSRRSRQIRQQGDGGLHQQTGRGALSISSSLSGGSVDLGFHAPALPESSAHSRSAQRGSGPDVKGRPERGRVEVETVHRFSDLGTLRPSTGGSVCVTSQHTVSSMVLAAHTGQTSAGSRCVRAPFLAERSTVRISTSGLHPSLAGSGEVGGAVGHSDSPRSPRSPVVPGTDGDAGRRALAHTSPDGCALSGRRPGEEPSSDRRPTYGLATERELLERRYLSDAVIQTTQSARTQSTA